MTHPIDSSDQVVSTAEAIRMSSACILGTTTSKDVALGSAAGSGTRLRDNSHVVAMEVVPLISAFSTKLRDKANLELISLEWDLGTESSSEILPEHLIICAGKEDDFSTHTCAITWERGVIDPFRLDAHLHGISRKMKQIEDAILSNDVEYESQGISVLRKFCNRMNMVMFVEMLDRKFQERWDSTKIQREDVDISAESISEVRMDYSTLPPTLRISGPTSFKFTLPSVDESQKLDHFQKRIVSPSALRSLTSGVLELGRAIVAEINTYAYSTEEVDITRATIALLVKYLDTESVPISDLDMISSRLSDFAGMIELIMNKFAEVTEDYVRSGEELTTNEHKSNLSKRIEDTLSDRESLAVGYAKILLEHLTSSIENELKLEDAYRAWRLRSIITYFNYMAKRVQSFFVSELSNYVAARAVKISMMRALEAFETSIENEDLTKEEKRIFQRLHSTLKKRIDRSVDRMSYSGDVEIDELLSMAAKEIEQEFRHIDIWSIFDFTDIAGITKPELESMIGQTPDSDDIDTSGVLNLLSRYEDLETTLIPDLSEYILTKENIDALSNSTSEQFLSTLRQIVFDQKDKPEEWHREAERWIERIQNSVDDETPVSKQLIILLEVIYSELMEGGAATSIIERIRREAMSREDEYSKLVDEWKAKCEEIEEKNLPIREHNEKRKRMIEEAKQRYEQEMESYKKELARTGDTEVGITEGGTVEKPKEPQTLDSRLKQIDDEYPLQEEIPLPEKPEVPITTKQYSILRNLLDENLSEFEASLKEMQSRFMNELSKLESQAEDAFANITIRVDAEFLEYVMDSKIRRLSKASATPARAYLRNTENNKILYLVNYSHSNDELTVEIGNNMLRR